MWQISFVTCKKHEAIISYEYLSVNKEIENIK